ncbi:MAG: class I SAM-dependent methyltransferase [Clostridiales bacterium]|nr:class I SAM-dependent methyltransferase [Clostridiales bacterium]
MREKNSNFLFNMIAPIYGHFYKSQKKKYAEIIGEIQKQLDISSFETIIDIGCGTGALCSVLKDKGLEVTGVEPAKRMLKIGMDKIENKNINFIQADVLKGLPFSEKSFDIAIASFVAHGLKANERKLMYANMSRVAKKWVIIHDYNGKRELITSIIEWLEGGDYFNFIKNVEPEMKNCLLDMKACFSEVHIIQVDVRANWYICKPNK